MPDFQVFKHLTPAIYAHIHDAIEDGHPEELTYWPTEDPLNARVNPAVLNPNRVQALAHNVEHFLDRNTGVPRRRSAGTDMSWDEYPFACTQEGGTDSSVRAVPMQEQSRQGGALSGFIRTHNLTRGSTFRVVLRVLSVEAKPTSNSLDSSSPKVRAAAEAVQKRDPST